MVPPLVRPAISSGTSAPHALIWQGKETRLDKAVWYFGNLGQKLQQLLEMVQDSVARAYSVKQ